MKSQQDTITLLRLFREECEEKVKFFRTVFITFFAILFIDLNIIIFLRVDKLSALGWVGIWSLITALGVTFYLYWDAKVYIRSIDEFYLQKIMDLKKKG